MPKKEKCWIPLYPRREARGWWEERKVIPGTAYPGFPGLVYDPKVQGPVGRISCYKAFLQEKRRAKETGVLTASYKCDKGYPSNRRIEVYGGYAFSKEVQEVNRWESNWGDGRVAVRFKWGDEIWVGTAFRGARFEHCDEDPTGNDTCRKYHPEVDPETGQMRHLFVNVRGRRRTSYNMGDCDDGLYGIFRRASFTRRLSKYQRDYPFEYKTRSKASLMKHWKATAEIRRDRRAEDRRARIFDNQRWLR